MNFSRKISVRLAVGAMVLALTACGGKQKPQQHPVAVSAITIHKKEVPISYEYAARVAALKKTEVRARVGGILLHRNFTEGAEVKQGDILFEIDPDTYEAAVERAQAQVAQAQATYDQSLRDASRVEELVKQRVQSAAQRDQAFATRDANAAALKQAQAELKTAQLNLQYTKVAAPIGGLTSREAVNEGSLIGTDSSSSLLTSITQIDPIYVNFSYTDTDFQHIKQILSDMANRGEAAKDLLVNIRFGDGSTYAEQGVIDFTSPTLDELTGTLGVRAIVPNHDHQLVPGQFVRVTLVGLKLANAITIPEKALLQDANGQYVLVIRKITVPAKAGTNNKNQPEQTMLVATRRDVKVERQLQSRDWLLDNGAIIHGQTGNVASNKTEGDADQTDQKPQPVQSVVGLEEGDILLTDGQYMVQNALAQLASNAPGVPVMITNLDGKPIESSTSKGDQTKVSK